ncbi:MAG: hypothetical protein M9935_05485 [Kiritimatiellae bacterium]|nr:hypothetical protein [Kiritimatiellia bacterium]
MAVNHIFIPALFLIFLALVVATPAILGALARLAFRHASPGKLSLCVGVVFVLVHSLIARPYTELVNTEVMAHYPHLQPRFANALIVFTVLFQLFLSSAIALAGIRLVDRKRNASLNKPP